MKAVIIIGGGITGLAAAYKLGNVLVLEKEKELGGLLASYFINGFYIEKFYHHFFSTNVYLISFLKELGLEKNILWLPAKVGYLVDGKIFSLNTPLEIIKFPPLYLWDKIKLAFFTLRAKITNKEKLDEVLAKDWILKNCGRRVYEKFFLPLLKAKFGDNFHTISAAWLASRIALRSNRGWRGEVLGYLKGGFQTFLNRLSEEIKKNGGEIKTNFTVKKIIIEKNKVKGVIGKNGKSKEEFFPAQKIISTVSPSVLKEILGKEFEKIDLKIKFQGTSCLLLSLKAPLLKDIYWLNLEDKLPFGAVIEHTNFISPKEYGGEHLVYFASYFQNEKDQLISLDDFNLFKIYLKAIEKIFPFFKKENINWWKIYKSLEAGPIYEVGYKKKIVPYSTPIEGLYLAGTFSKENYPERSIEGALKSGFEIAQLCKK